MDLDLAAGDGFKQIVCHNLRVFTGAHVRKQGLSRDIQRTLAAQHARCESRNRTRRITKASHQA